MLGFCLFGSGEISYENRNISGLCHQLPGQLLCYLLLNREKPQDREHLAAIFWGNLSITDSKKALRNNLWRLRQTLQSANIPISEYLFLDEKKIGFIGSSRYSLDVEDFETLVIPCKDLQGFDLSPSQAVNLESALSLYRGDLLENIYEDWCIYDRERLHMLFINVLCKLMVYYGCNRSYESAIEYGNHLLSLDNTLETIHRQLMFLYWMSGKRKKALTQYHICSQTLREELKCEPMRETRRIYKQMLHDQVAPEDWSEICRPSIQINSSSSTNDSPACRRIQSELHRLQGMIEDAQSTSRTLEQLISEALDK